MSAVALSWRQLRLERRMFWRNPTAAFFSFVLPLLLLVLYVVFGAGDPARLRTIVPGIVGVSLMATSFHALAMTMTVLRENGVLKRMRGTPLPSGSYLAALTGSALVNGLILLVIAVGMARWSFGLGWPREWGTLLLFVVVGGLSLAALGVAWSHAIPSVDAAPAWANAVFLPTVAISGAFYDIGEAPALIRDIAGALPLAHLIEGLKVGMTVGGPVPWTHLVFVAVWGLAGAVVAVRGFRWDPKDA